MQTKVGEVAGAIAAALAVANHLPVFVIDKCPQAPIGEITTRVLTVRSSSRGGWTRCSGTRNRASWICGIRPRHLPTPTRLPQSIIDSPPCNRIIPYILFKRNCCIKYCKFC